MSGRRVCRARMDSTRTRRTGCFLAHKHYWAYVWQVNKFMLTKLHVITCTYNTFLDTQHFLLWASCAISTHFRWWKRTNWCYSATIYVRIHWSNSLVASSEEVEQVTTPSLLSSSRTLKRWGWWIRSIMVLSEETAGREKRVSLMLTRRTSSYWQRSPSLWRRNHDYPLTF